MDQQQKCTVLLIGKTGSGKSATGNSILGKKLFASKNSTASVTAEVQIGTFDVDGVSVTVIDGPGFGDAELTDDQTAMQAIKYIEDAFKQCPQGFDAILYVASIKERFTEDYTRHLEILRAILGAQALRDVGMFLLTRIDQYDSEENGMNVTDWCRVQTGAFEEILQACSDRLIFFNNRTKDETLKWAQVDELLQRVFPIINNRYTWDHYCQAAKSRKAVLVKAQLPAISQEVDSKIALLKRRLDETENSTPEEKIRVSRQLMKDVEDLRRDIMTKDEHTNVLAGQFRKINNFENMLENLHKTATESIKMREQMRRRAEEMKAKQERERLRLQRERREMERERERREQRLREERERMERQVRARQREIEEFQAEQRREQAMNTVVQGVGLVARVAFWWLLR